jgi:hypothetical protein
MTLRSNRNIKFYIGVFFLFGLSGCVSAPKESVELSSNIGKGILESQRSYNALLNIYFASKKTQVDQWIEKEYIPEYLANIQSELKKAGKSAVLSSEQMADVLHDVIVERDQKQTDLENTRLLLLTKSNEHYAALLQSNNGVTSLLQSMVDIKNASSTSAQTIKVVSGGKIDLEKLERNFNGYLKVVGAASSKATSLYDTVKTEIETKGE